MYDRNCPIVVLLSGGGTNLQALIDAAEQEPIDAAEQALIDAAEQEHIDAAEQALIDAAEQELIDAAKIDVPVTNHAALSNRRDPLGPVRARRAGIETRFLQVGDYSDRAAYDNALGAPIDAAKVTLPVTIRAVISNRRDAFGLVRARRAGIETHVLQVGDYPDRDAYDNALRALIDGFSPRLVVLAGFMLILSDDFVNHYAGRMLNIHPSLLPLYRGLNTHARALEAGDAEHGATVHFVTPELDAGPIITQARVPIRANDTPETLAARVLEQEHIIYPRAIRWFAEERLTLCGHRALLDGKPCTPSGSPEEADESVPNTHAYTSSGSPEKANEPVPNAHAYTPSGSPEEADEHVPNAHAYTSSGSPEKADKHVPNTHAYTPSGSPEEADEHVPNAHAYTPSGSPEEADEHVPNTHAYTP